MLKTIYSDPARILLAALLLASCGLANGELRIHVVTNQNIDAAAFGHILAEQSNLRLIDADVPDEFSVIDALTSDATDLGLIENSTPFTPGIRAVLPMFESVLHILIRDNVVANKPTQSLRGASFYVINQSPAGRKFVELVTYRQGLSAGDYTISHEFIEGETDIIIYFGPIDPDNTSWARAGFTLASLDNQLNPQRKFYKEGIGYVAPNMKSKTIPPLTYNLPGNDDALLTVAVDTLLVARKEVPERKIYELTKTFLEQKPRFTAIAPQLFAGINESFDPLDLNFPLHNGARYYLERDDPGLLERYAETINMLMYVIVVIITGLIGLARWRARKKKDRIDVFYQRVMAIRDSVGSKDAESLLQELETLEREAFDSLIREKLAANESFRIFTDMLARLRRELTGQRQNW